MVWTYEYTLALFALGGLLITVIWWAIYSRSYNIKIIIRNVVKDRKLITYDWGKLIIDDKGIEKLRFRFDKVDIHVPNPKAFELDSKGKRFIEFYKFSDLDYAPVCDTATLEDLKDTTGIFQGVKHNGIFRKKDDVAVRDHKDQTFQPMNTNQRLSLANQIRKAMERKRKSWLDIIMQLAPLIVLMIIAVCLIIFWGDMAKPLLDFQANQLIITNKQYDTMKILDAVIYDKQDILFERFNTTMLNKTIIP